MFKQLHKPQMSGSIHSGHFMVSRLDDDDDDDNNDPADDSSESERDNAQSVEIDIHNPDSVADAAKNLDLSYSIGSPSTKNEQVTSWNDLDRPTKKLQKQNQYLTYYTNTSSNFAISQQTTVSDSHAPSTVLDARLLVSDNGSTSSSASVATPTNLVMNNSSSSAMQQQQQQNEQQQQPPQRQHQQHQQQRQQQQSHNRAAVPDGFSITTSPAMVSQTNKAPMLSSSAADALLNEASRQLQLQQRQQHGDQQLQLATRQHQQQMQLAAVEAADHGQHAHQVTIDTSLTKLLQCMSLYYSSKLTSPKWKSFKGLKLRLKYKIRLNNLIWRAWFLQYIRGRRPPGCQFVAPAETDVHKKSETIVLEGKYWKRKEKAIVDEYKKWRIFNIHKQKNQLHCFRPSSFDWDSRVSNLASSGPEYHFYPDYDMSMNYNLDEIPPMLEEQEQQPSFYQASVSTSQQQHQQPQQQQMVDLAPSIQPETVSNIQNSHDPFHSSRIMGSDTPVSQHNQALSLKPERPTLTENQTHQTFPQNFGIHNQHQDPLASTFNLSNNLAYQQQQSNSGQHQRDHAHQIVSDDQMVSMDQDLPMSSGSSCSGRNEQRRVCHINAEQKRRCNIKNGFDTLRSILPSVNQNVNFKISKASMLQKAAHHITNLTAEQKQQSEERAMLKQQIDTLKQTINAYQSQLPASGTSASGQNTVSSSTSQAREMLQEYIKRRTLENWKFWIFSLLIEPLFQTYHQTVNTNSLEDACKTIFTWLDQSCGLVSLRKEVLESLTFLSTSTNILHTPHTLPTEAVDAVRYPANNTNSSNVQHSQQLMQGINNHQCQVTPSTTSVSHSSPVSNAAASMAAAASMVLSRQQSIQLMPQQQQQQHHVQSAQFQQARPFQMLPTGSAQRPQQALQQIQQLTANAVPPNALQAHAIRSHW